MNRWEKEVQQSLLDSEEAALKELEAQFARALRDINEKVKGFQADIDLLDQALSQDGLDDAARALLQSQKRSKVYQQQYQKALQGQVSGILDKLHGDNYATIEGYLKGCYDDGYIGTMYDIAKQGVPVIAPIDQAAAVKAILTDSKVSNGLYNALGVDVAKLKKTITQEISRGIASSLPYRDIARNIGNVSGAPLSRAKTIARTEGHRIQQMSTVDAQQATKAKGADVLKQWDATLDGRTRESHRRVDGEIRELDEKFSNGLMFPGDPSGGAAEVVNCRCTSNTRARWALGEEELQTLKDRAEYFGLDKTKNFEEYKEKYLTAAESVSSSPITTKPKKEYLTEKKLGQKIDDISKQQASLISSYKDTDDFLKNASAFDVDSYNALEKQKLEYQAKLDAKVIAKQKKNLIKQEADIQNQIASVEANSKTYSFPGKSGKWTNVSADDWDDIKDDIDKKKKYFENLAIKAQDQTEFDKYAAYVKQLSELETDGKHLAGLKADLAKVQSQINNIGKGKPSSSSVSQIVSNAKTFSNAPDAVQYHTANNFSQNFWNNTLSPDERNAIKKYTGSSYRAMNTDLRTGHYATSSVKGYIDDCTSALAKCAIADDVVVYRGMGSQKSVARLCSVSERDLAIQSVRDALIGTRITEKGFMSTAIVSGKAWSGAQLEVYLPKGAHGMYVDPVSTFSGELELLLQRNSTFEIQDIIANSNGEVTKIVLVLIDQTI